MNRYVVIMAAGKGSRMKSLDVNRSKVSYPILGKALVNYVIDAVSPLNVDKIVTIVGFGGEVTKELVKDRSEVVWQKDPKGTGHAVMQASDILKDLDGETLVLCGDTPLLTTEMLELLLKKHELEKNSLTLVSAILENPKGYGRIVRNEKTFNVLAIREDKDCSEYEKSIKEVNSGIYVFDNKKLFSYLKNIQPNNAQHEYYLTDIIDMFVKDGLKVGAFVTDDPVSTYGINDRVQLAYASKVIRKRINTKLMLSGVTIEDPDTTYISSDVKIGQDTIISPNTSILGTSNLGTSNKIGPNVYLENVVVGNNNKIAFKYITDKVIGDDEILVD